MPEAPRRRCWDRARGAVPSRADESPWMTIGEGSDASERITMLELAFCFASTGQIQSWNHSCFLLQPISELETQLVFATTISFFCYIRRLYLLQSFGGVVWPMTTNNCNWEIRKVATHAAKGTTGNKKSYNYRTDVLQPTTANLWPATADSCNLRPGAATGVQFCYNLHFAVLPLASSFATTGINS